MNLFCQNEEDFEIKKFDFEKMFKGVCINNSAILNRYSRLSKTQKGREVFKEQTGKENADDFNALKNMIGTMTRDENSSEINCNYKNDFKKTNL